LAYAYKLAACQRRAEYWREEHRITFKTLLGDQPDRAWKALALIEDAYDELDERQERGCGASCMYTLTIPQLGKQVFFLRKITCVEMGSQLALRPKRTCSGRWSSKQRAHSKFLPKMVAQGFFIDTVAIAFGRTVSAAISSSSASIFINVEAHSIAFSAPYFWVIHTVIISSIIGVSRTEAAIPGILKRFKTDLDRAFPGKNVALPSDILDYRHTRVFHGGLYLWQPAKRPRTSENVNGKFINRVKMTIQSGFLPNALLMVGMLTVIIVCLVPPDGSRLGIISILISAQFDTILECLVPYTNRGRTLIFRVIGVKDLIVMLSTMLGIVGTQIGLFNRCACYTRWGRTGVALPEMPDVQNVLIHRMQTAYPAITFTCVGIQLILVPLHVASDIVMLFVCTFNAMTANPTRSGCGKSMKCCNYLSRSSEASSKNLANFGELEREVEQPLRKKGAP